MLNKVLKKVTEYFLMYGVNLVPKPAFPFAFFARSKWYGVTLTPCAEIYMN